MKKVYLINEDEVVEIEREEDGSIDTLTGMNPCEFEDRKEMLKFLIQSELEEDGQVFRFINEFMEFLVVSVSEEVFNSLDYAELQNKDFSEVDICKMISIRVKELEKNFRQQIKKEEKEFDYEDI
jgi:hypothetical protein